MLRSTMLGPKRLTRAACCTLALLALAATPAELLAQRPQRYRPARPTVSPYLNLLRNNVSPLPNYYSLVRPQQYQLEVNRQQQALQLQQNTAIRQLQTGLLRTQTTGPVTGSSSWFQNPGSRSTFQNTSSYYSRVGR